MGGIFLLMWAKSPKPSSAVGYSLAGTPPSRGSTGFALGWPFGAGAGRVGHPEPGSRRGVPHRRPGDGAGQVGGVGQTEQKRIVAKVEHLMKLCDALEATLRRREDRAAKLAEAVVQEMVA
jgi:hypothetical protein